MGTIFWEPLNLDNLAYDPATATVVVRLCWAEADISDRPWRKFKNPADEDRQCKNKVAADKNREFSTNNYTFTVSGNQPEGRYWARVLVIQDSSYVATGGSADAGSSPPTTDCDLMETNTNGEFVCETFQINNVMHQRWPVRGHRPMRGAGPAHAGHLHILRALPRRQGLRGGADGRHATRHRPQLRRRAGRDPHPQEGRGGDRRRERRGSGERAE